MTNSESCHIHKLEQYIKQLNDIGFDYISGGESSTDYMTVRCQYCGTIRQVQGDYLGRKTFKKLHCKVCDHFEAEIRKEQRRIKRHEESLKRQAIKRFEKSIKALIKLKTPPKPRREYKERTINVFVCSQCGENYESKRERMMCPKCYRKKANSIHWNNRRATIKNVMVDKDIDIRRVYEKDNGICYLCKCKVDVNDYKTDGETFIRGANYPSIDHVVPLAKGGKHSWDNVRLAHRKCNWEKKDKIISPPL